MLQKPSEPDFVVAWREWTRKGPPRCCHTCEFYSPKGECGAFHMVPPPEFAEKTDACEKWTQELPF
jgi:hypothetical protein